MVAQSGKERRLAQHFALDIEEHRPERSVEAIGYLVAGVQNKIRLRVLQNAGHHAPVHIVPGARITVDYKLVGATSRRCLERSGSSIAPFDVVVISLPDRKSTRLNSSHIP